MERLLERRLFRAVNVAGVLAVCFFLGGMEQGLLGQAGGSQISAQMLYGSYSYQNGGGSLLIRGLLLIVGFNWICFFMWVFPGKRIPGVSSIGQNTLPVFLLHGFVRKYLESRGGIFVYSWKGNMVLAALVSLAVLAVFGNRYFSAGFRILFAGEGLERLRGKRAGERDYGG